MAKNKAARLMKQLEEEGLGNTHRVLAIHHQVLAELTGTETKQEIPERHIPKPARKQVPEGVESPPSAGEKRHGRDARAGAPKKDSKEPPSEISTEEVKLRKDDETEFGAKDSRIDDTMRIEDARSAVGGEKDAQRQEAAVREAIAADDELAAEHGVQEGTDYPDSEDADSEAAADEGDEDASDEDSEDADEDADDDEASDDEPEPARRRTRKSLKKAKKRR